MTQAQADIALEAINALEASKKVIDAFIEGRHPDAQDVATFYCCFHEVQTNLVGGEFDSHCDALLDSVTT